MTNCIKPNDFKPNGIKPSDHLPSSAGLDCISPQILKDLTAKSNGQTGLNFLRALTNLVNVVLGGKEPFELQAEFFGAKLIPLKKARWRTSSYRYRQYFPPIVRKMCRIPCLRITSSKIWKSTRKKPKRDRKQQQKSELDRRLCSICTKLDEGNVKAGIRMAVGDNKVADFTVDNYAALKLKHPQRETCSVPHPTDIDCFSNSELFVHNVLISVPNGSSAGLDGISPKSLKDLTTKSNGQTGLNFFRALTNLVNVNLEGKKTFRTSAVLFWCETNCAKKA